MVVHGGGEEAKRMKLKFEIVEVHFNFTSHDSVYFKKLVINFNFPVWAHTPPKHNMSPSCHHPKLNISFFLVYTNIYLPIDRACATTVVSNRRNDIEGWHRRLKKTAGEVEKTGEKAGRHEMGGSSTQDASNLCLEIFPFSYICTNRDVFANEKICP